MANRTKRIFISDIHMGDARSMSAPNPYVWFKDNIALLARFLDDQLTAPDVKEVVILGDLFDEWVIPVEYDPITSFDAICSNADNKPVIDKLKALAAPDSGIKLAYVPGNHDMAMDVAGISATKQFLEAQFPGIRFFCDNLRPWGVFSVATIAAEHGNRYCLFNAPDMRTRPGDFLPLGYFISRMVAHKVLTAGQGQDPFAIFIKFLKEFQDRPEFIKDMFISIANDAGLKPRDSIKLTGVPGYTDKMTVNKVGTLFSGLISTWGQEPGNINVPSAIMGDLGSLYYAAASTYFHIGSHINVVIFGHTHGPVLTRSHYQTGTMTHNGGDSPNTPCRTIYANAGTWVDKSKSGCTYVETEDVPGDKRLYVRVKSYPGNAVVADYEGFIET
jgi:UDP-2,3-diacylglucosamine pyrophosphatase LpxH